MSNTSVLLDGYGFTHWASGLIIGLNNNGLGRPLAQWVIRLLGWVLDHELFDDPYKKEKEIV